MGRLDHGLEASEELEVAYALEQIHGSLAALKDSYKILRDLQADLPNLSDNPLIAELIRVGQLAMHQKIPMDSFLERLTIYADMQDRLQQALLTAQPAPRERSILEAAAAASLVPSLLLVIERQVPVCPFAFVRSTHPPPLAPSVTLLAAEEMLAMPCIAKLPVVCR